MHERLEELRRMLKELLEIPKTAYKVPSIVHTDAGDGMLQSEKTECTVEKEFNKENAYIQQMNKKMMLEEKILGLEVQLERLIEKNQELSIKVNTQRTEIINLKGNIRVMCRIRPGAGGENLSFDENSITVENKRFFVDRVFPGKSSQADIYNEMESLVEGVLDGYNVCIFAYGQTGSGKTYTMEGTVENRGLVYRSLEAIAAQVELLTRDGCAVKFRAKYIEIYNETIRDLVGGEQVQIMHENENVSLKGCHEIHADDLMSISGIVRQASRRRVVGETRCNDKSSRSHLVLILTMLVEAASERKEGSLVLIDLAGSERLAESNAENERLKETQNINRSLSALGNVFSALRKKERHVPFRDSKLTHLMKNYLTGKSRTTMIVNVNPENANESISSLRFASKVAECELGTAGRNIHGSG